MIRELHEKFTKKELSPLEYLQEKLSFIQSQDSNIGAFIETEAEEATEAARQSEVRFASGAAKGLLDGIPVGIKDNIVTRGRKTECASRILAGYRSPFSAHVIEKLHAGGVVAMGRLNMDEFAMGSSTENSSIQKTRNPHNTDYAPGGSSGGSAAAVAAGFVPAALGSDTGGSIRQPAAFTGTVGLKPTYGTVSRYGLIAFASSLDQIGPLTITVDDSRLLYEAMKGHDHRDSTSVPNEAYVQVDPSPSKLRIGVPFSLIEGSSPEVMKSLHETIEFLKKEMGVEIIEIDMPHQQYGIPVYYITATSEASANLARFDGIRYGKRAANPDSLNDLYETSRTQGFGQEVKRRILLGTYALSSGFYDAFYGKAQRVRTLIQQDYLNAFEKTDAILMPTTPTPAFKLGEKTSNPVEMYLSDVMTVGASLAGVPALSVPGPSNGMPIGLQLQGPFFSEERLFRIGEKIEKAFPVNRVLLA